MNNNVTKVRLWVFKIWFVTLTVILLVFASKYSGMYLVKPTFDAVFQSLQMMTGLVVPQIGMMVAFYLNIDRHKEKLEQLSSARVTMIVWLSIFYHVLFIVMLIAGIGFYVFDQRPDGYSLQRNTSAVLAIMGIFSVFVTPVAFLFGEPKKE